MAYSTSFHSDSNQTTNYTESQDIAYDYLIKCIMVGDSGVGKSSLLLQFIDGKFVHYHDITIGVEFGSKMIIVNGKKIKLQIWDTAGQESFRSITRSYYKDSGAVILVYDISSTTSFVTIEKWIKDIKNMCNNPHIILVGNKCDLTDRRRIQTGSGKKFAADNNMLFIETSAKDTKNVDEVFITIATKTLDAIQKGEIDLTNPSNGIRVGDFKPYITLGSSSFNNSIKTIKSGKCC